MAESEAMRVLQEENLALERRNRELYCENRGLEERNSALVKELFDSGCEVEEAVNDAELLRNELAEAQRQIEELRTENRNLRESSIRQSQKAVRLELEKDTTSLERHNRELRWQLTKSLGKLSAEDIHEVLGSTEE